MRTNFHRTLLLASVVTGLAPGSYLFAETPRRTPTTSTAPAELTPSTLANQSKELVIPLYYDTHGSPLGLSPGDQYTKSLLDTSSSPMKNIPKPGDGKRYWGELTLGLLNQPNHIPFIIDDTSAGVMLYADTDQDGDLTNSGPIKNQGTRGFGCLVDLQITYGSKKSPYRVWFFINEYVWARKTGAFYAHCHRTGQVAIGFSPYPMVIFDNPSDGDYSNDPVNIDLNLDGKVQDDEKFTVGQRIGNSKWVLRSISPTGDEVRFSLLTEADSNSPPSHKNIVEKPDLLKDEIVRLSYVNAGFPLGESTTDSVVKPYPVNPLATMKNIPTQNGGKRTWGELTIGPSDKPNRIPYLIDQTSQEPEGIAMYMDGDQDGDFANNPPIRMFDFHNVDIQIVYGLKRMPYRMCFMPREGRNTFYCKCHQRGQLLIENVSYPVVIFDNPPDGEYSNDPVIIDLNLNGKVESNEKFKVGDVIHIGNAQATLKSISPAGDEVRFSP